jgi:hypothetical protein
LPQVFSPSPKKPQKQDYSADEFDSDSDDAKAPLDKFIVSLAQDDNPTMQDTSRFGGEFTQNSFGAQENQVQHSDDEFYNQFEKQE